MNGSSRHPHQFQEFLYTFNLANKLNMKSFNSSPVAARHPITEQREGEKVAQGYLTSRPHRRLCIRLQAMKRALSHRRNQDIQALQLLQHRVSCLRRAVRVHRWRSSQVLNAHRISANDSMDSAECRFPPFVTGTTIVSSRQFGGHAGFIPAVRQNRPNRAHKAAGVGMQLPAVSKRVRA